MIRYYYTEVDVNTGIDIPEKIFNTEYSARQHYNSIQLDDFVDYKCLSAVDDQAGTILLAQEG